MKVALSILAPLAFSGLPALADKPQPAGACRVAGTIEGALLHLSVACPEAKEDALVEVYGVDGLQVDGDGRRSGDLRIRTLHQGPVQAGATLTFDVGFKPGPGRSMVVVTAGGSPVSFSVGELSAEQARQNAEGLQTDSEGRPIRVMNAEKAEPAAVPADLLIELSSSGGITGGGGGHSIAADGTVTRWERATFAAQRTTSPAGVIDRATLVGLLRLIDEARFFQSPEGEPSNMTTELTVRRAGEQHTVRGVPLSRGLLPLQQAIQAAIDVAGK